MICKKYMKETKKQKKKIFKGPKSYDASMFTTLKMHLENAKDDA